MRERVRAARGYGGPREWVLTAALASAARGPGTRRREVASRECDNIQHADSTTCIPECTATLGVEDLWVDFGSRGRLHATAFRPSARVANPTPRQNEPQGEVPDP